MKININVICKNELVSSRTDKASVTKPISYSIPIYNSNKGISMLLYMCVCVCVRAHVCVCMYFFLFLNEKRMRFQNSANSNR